MRIGHVKGIVISGVVWLSVGGLLTYKGLVLLSGVVLFSHSGGNPLMNILYPIFRTVERSGMGLVLIAILLGQLKGSFVLAKTVKRFVKRILLIPSPIRIQDLFPWRYLLLIGAMMSLGMLLRFLSIPKDIKAFIDLTIGSALMSGAFLYFKQASMLKLELAKRKKQEDSPYRG